jgi:PAS domain S-box-containing protein
MTDADGRRSTPPWGSVLAVTWPIVVAMVLLLLVNLVALRASDVLQVGLAAGSRWTKAQQTAVIHLLRHLETGDAQDLRNFEESLQVPLAARRGREAMVEGRYDDVLPLLRGRGLSDEEIIERVRLFRLASHLPEFEDIVTQWAVADALIVELQRAAKAAVAVNGAPVSDGEREARVIRVVDLDRQLTQTMEGVSQSLVATSRRFRSAQVAFNIGLAAILLLFSVLLAGRGVTRLARSQAAVRVANERYELAVAAANDGLWDWHLGRGTLVWTPRTRELLGYDADPDFAAAGGWRSLFHPEDLRATLSAVHAHRDGKTPALDLTTRLRLRDGSYRWFRIRGSALREDGRRPERMLGTLSDVDDRVRAEQARAKAQHEREQAASGLELALNAAHVALWSYEPSSGRILQNRRWDTLLGHEAMPDTFDSWQLLVHPDDREQRRARLQQHLDGATPYHESEFRMRHAAGHWVWLRSRGRVTRRDEAGHALEYAGAVMDLSEQVAVRELQRRQHEFLQAMVEGIDTGIILSSMEHVQYVNASLCRMLGHESKDALIGAAVTDIAASREQAESMMSRRRAAAAGTELALSVTDLVGAGGRLIKVVSAVSHVRWNDESHFVTTVTPLSGFERTEAKLRSAEARFERMLLGHLDAQQAQIGRELHDSIGSALAGLSLLVSIAKSTAAAGGSVDDVLDRCQQQVQSAVETIRGLARGLMPVDAQPGSLLHSLEQFTHGISAGSHVEVTLDVSGNLEDIPQPAANQIYRIVQESVSNALRHGKATRIRIAIEDEPGGRTVSIEDNGSGLPPAWLRSDGIGLRSMRARAGSMGGSLRFAAGAEGGTQVILKLAPTSAPV